MHIRNSQLEVCAAAFFKHIYDGGEANEHNQVDFTKTVKVDSCD